jgi:hypothetical protein
MEFPGSQLLLQLMILQEQPRQPSFQAGPGRNAVLYKKMDYKNLGFKQPKEEEHSPHIGQKNGKGGQYYTAAVLQRQPNARKMDSVECIERDAAEESQSRSIPLQTKHTAKTTGGLHRCQGRHL